MMIAVAVFAAVGTIAVPLSVCAEALAPFERAGKAGVQYFVDTPGYADYLLNTELIEVHLGPPAHTAGNYHIHLVVLQQLRNTARLVAGVLKFSTVFNSPVDKINQSIERAAPEVRCHLTSFCCNGYSHTSLPCSRN